MSVSDMRANHSDFFLNSYFFCQGCIGDKSIYTQNRGIFMYYTSHTQFGIWLNFLVQNNSFVSIKG